MQDSFGHLHTQRCRLRVHGHFNSPHRNIHQKTKKTCFFFYFSFFLSGIFLSTSSPFSHKIHMKPAQKEAVVCGGVPSSNHHDWKLKPAWMGLKMEYK